MECQCHYWPYKNMTVRQTDTFSLKLLRIFLQLEFDFVLQGMRQPQIMYLHSSAKYKIWKNKPQISWTHKHSLFALTFPGSDDELILAGVCWQLTVYLWLQKGYCPPMLSAAMMKMDVYLVSSFGEWEYCVFCLPLPVSSCASVSITDLWAA